MITPGETIRINGEDYQAAGNVNFYRKPGESSVQLHVKHARKHAHKNTKGLDCAGLVWFGLVWLLCRSYS